MDDYVDERVGDPSVISRRALIRKGMLAAGAGLWAVPVVAVVARNSGAGRQTATEGNIVPANHGGPAVTNCAVQGSGPGCITFDCSGPTPTFVECVGNPVGSPAGPGPNLLGPGPGGPDVCFCSTDIAGVCRCFANEDCADLLTCPNFGAPNGGCPAGFFCINLTCCGDAKCAQVCT